MRSETRVRSGEAAVGWLSHPWPNVGGKQVGPAALAAVRYCIGRGYAQRHAAQAVMEWNGLNRPPMDGLELARIVCREYGSADTGRGREGGKLIALSQAAAPAEREWLVPGILPAGQRVGLLGRWGCGKSFLALDLAFAVAFGTRFLGVHRSSAGGNVVILDGEGGMRRARTRFGQVRAARAGLGSRGATDIYWRAGHDLALGGVDTARIVDGLCRELEGLQPALVVFDTLAKVMGLSDENSNSAATRVTSALNAIGERLEATLLVLAHPSKALRESDTVRGAGELSADLDVLWSVRYRKGTPREAECVKDRDGDIEGRRFRFDVEARSGAVAPEGEGVERVTAAIEVILRSTGVSLTAGDLEARVRAECGVGRTTFRRRLDELRQVGAIDSDKGRWRLAQ